MFDSFLIWFNLLKLFKQSNSDHLTRKSISRFFTENHVYYPDVNKQQTNNHES